MVGECCGWWLWVLWLVGLWLVVCDLCGFLWLGFVVGGWWGFVVLDGVGYSVGISFVFDGDVL